VLASGLTALLTAILAAGCSTAPGGQAVFRIGGGYTTGFPTHTDEPDDVGLSTGWLHNTTGSAVRLTAVRFPDPPASLRMLRVYAVSYKDTQGSGLISGEGVLYKECPHFYRPHPLSVVTVGPHSDANWLVVISFTISRPGIYHLSRVRLDYTTQGHTGWQYQNINETVTVKNPPLPGPRPLPRVAVCDLPPA
jgi:hypothetical protein